MSAFCRVESEAIAAATRRSGHFGQRRGIGLAVIQLSELRQRLSGSVNPKFPLISLPIVL